VEAVNRWDQGYLTSTKECAVRVRIAADKAYLTVKGPSTGVTRLEFEYPIPIADAATMPDRLCQQPLIEKTRYREEFEGHRWEVDEFHGDNSGRDCGNRACKCFRTICYATLGGSGSLTRPALFQRQSSAQSIQKKLEDITGGVSKPFSDK
jgi:hypothetical protein